MLSSPKPPAAPDPNKTAAAQAGMNVDTAQAQQLTNMTNQVGPDGSLTYTKTGDTSFVNSQGKTVVIPQYTATTAYSADQQKLADLNNQTQQQIGQIGLDQSKRIGDLLGTPVDLSNDATEARLMELGRTRLDPVIQQREEATRQRLADQGLQPGSDAWNRAMAAQGNQTNDAYNSLLLNGRQQAVQEALTARNQPINEISALLNGSQVSQPTFQNTPQSQVGGVDYTGLVSQNYATQMQGYQQQVQSQNAMMGGLFGLAAAPFSMFKFSDRRLKHSIQLVGRTARGWGLYVFRYLGATVPSFGFMADELPAHLTRKVAGFLQVDYDAAWRQA